MFDKFADKVISWTGSTNSILVHTLFFIVIFALRLIGLSLESILLILTTAVSLEAIYLSLLIQRSVNKSSAALAEVAEDIEDVTEDLEEVTEDIDEIQSDIDEIQEDIDEIQEEDEPTKSRVPLARQLQKLKVNISENEKLISMIEQELVKLQEAKTTSSTTKKLS